ncbi:hypothetical protein ONZ51_g12144 [Trametes cubensis]|uniref:Integrase catalytic domain-containing protein n=1 Tax=Trametes cubensis TaxID=1111947 RepID=A0AAD7TJ14_9APHY|nr:hypothetical protein ONZ51_g12144 [Trametes cubensis]
MEQPEGFAAKGQEHKVLRLLRALYGLKQAGLAWWRTLNESMKELGFKHLVSDAGIFIFRDEDGGMVIVIVYVDDALFCGQNKALVNKMKAKFMEKWECRDLGECAYLEKVLLRCGMQNAKPAPTPLPAGYHPEPNNKPVDPILRSRFQTVIGSLLYIMLGTRPDIAFAVTKLSQFAANPSQEHLTKALYICRYLLGTRSYSLVYNGASGLGLCACTDSDWGSDPFTRRSQTGYFLKLAGGIFSWQSRAQKTVAHSSTEAKYMAISDCSRQVVWIRNLMSEIGYELAPIPIAGDSQGSLFMSSNPVTESRSKHIDIRYHAIREYIENKQVEVFFVDGSDNPADLFTKNLGHVKFTNLRARAHYRVSGNGHEATSLMEKVPDTVAEDQWKKVYVTTNQKIDVHYHFEELYTTKYVEGSSMSEHIAWILRLKQAIRDAGEDISDLNVAHALVLSLPKTPAWDVVKIQLFSLESKELTSELVGAKLQAEANRRARENSSNEAALLAQKPQQKKGRGKGKGKGTSTLRPKPEDECRYCRGKGHWAKTCPRRQEDERKDGQGSANLAVGGYVSLELGHCVLAAIEDSNEARVNESSSKVILDTGATSHMFRDRSFFTSYTQLDTSESISVGDNGRVPVAGRGNVTLVCRLPGGHRTVTLTNVLHVPRLMTNLVSLGTLQRLGATFKSCGEDGLSVKLDHRELFRAYLSGMPRTLYVIDRVPARTGEVACVAGSSGSMRLWHRRLAHLNVESIREMSRKELVTGLDISSPREFDRVCEGCVLGKSHRLPFPKQSKATYEKCEMLVVDVTGPMSHPTWSGMWYALVVVEVSCRFGVGDLLPNKERMGDLLMKTVAKLERQSGRKVRMIRSDNGSEFVNSLLDTFCKARGIIRQTTVPYTPVRIPCN